MNRSTFHVSGAAALFAVAMLIVPGWAHAQECAPPRVAIHGHAERCCWPGQHWSSHRGECSGRPECPDGFRREHHECRAEGGTAAPPAPVAVASPPVVAVPVPVSVAAIAPPPVEAPPAPPPPAVPASAATPPSPSVEDSPSVAGLTTAGASTSPASTSTPPPARTGPRCGVIRSDGEEVVATVASPRTSPPGESSGGAPPSAADMATSSVQPLFLRARETFNLPPAAVTRFRTDLHFEDRYQMLDGSLSGGASGGVCPQEDTLRAVRAWCREATIDLQERRGDVDAQRGAANLTVEAINERCGMLFEYTLEAVEPAPCREGSACLTRAALTLHKYRVSGFDEAGQPRFALDPGFGTNGERHFDFSITLPGTPRVSTPFGTVAAIPSAVVSAGGAAMGIARQLQEVPQLQVHAPIRTVRDGDALFCGSRREVPLDTPFFVRELRAGVVQDVGFGRARDMLDGCTLTSSLRRARAAHRTVRLGPSRAQLIIGAGDVRPGMTLWQMPSIGLDVTFGLGVVSGQLDTTHPALKDFVLPTGLVGAEYNFGRWAGVSELYAVANVGVGVNFVDGRHSMWQGNSRYADQVRTTLDGLGFAPNLRVELGILKRFYFGRSFFELEALGYYGTTLLGTQAFSDGSGGAGTIDYTVNSFGGVGALGFGWALSPRVLMRLDAGIQAGVANPGITVHYGGIDLAIALPGSAIEVGPTFRWTFSYEL